MVSVRSASSDAVGELLLQLGNAAVQQLRRGAPVAVALGAFRLAAQVVDLLLELADAVEAGLLALPARQQPGQDLLLVAEVFTQPLEPVERCSVGLAFERKLLHAQPVDGALQLVDLDRTGVDLHPKA